MMKEQKFYIDSLPYEIELTARICHENARRLLEQLTDEVSIDEFTVLDTIIARPDLSQADLARIILKGKAHTGRFLMSLENKGFIERKVLERGGKLIKMSVVTDKGRIFYENVVKDFQAQTAKAEQIMSVDEISSIIKNLRKLRQAIERCSNIVFE
ncbi:MAG: MarR family winged helix-turn-helix transcriptional regulator [Candidatus Gastranaerophilaceae bacterium]